jgi:hypothetical protein
LTNTRQGETALDALNGAQFSIPVNSLFTNDATGSRDPKILKFFFGVLKIRNLFLVSLKLLTIPVQ